MDEPKKRDEHTMCYIARTTKPEKRHPIVGTVVCATVDDGTRTKEVAKKISDWINDSLTIERVPVWWVRLHFGSQERYRDGDQPPAVTK